MGDFGTYMSFIPDDVVEFRNRQRELIRAGIAATPELESRRVMIYVLAEIAVSLKRLADCKAEATDRPRQFPPCAHDGGTYSTTAGMFCSKCHQLIPPPMAPTITCAPLNPDHDENKWPGSSRR
jgi:hypothetical protein